MLHYVVLFMLLSGDEVNSDITDHLQQRQTADVKTTNHPTKYSIKDAFSGADVHHFDRIPAKNNNHHPTKHIAPVEDHIPVRLSPLIHLQDDGDQSPTNLSSPPAVGGQKHGDGLTVLTTPRQDKLAQLDQRIAHRRRQGNGFSLDTTAFEKSRHFVPVQLSDIDIMSPSSSTQHTSKNGKATMAIAIQPSPRTDNNNNSLMYPAPQEHQIVVSKSFTGDNRSGSSAMSRYFLKTPPSPKSLPSDGLSNVNITTKKFRISSRTSSNEASSVGGSPSIKSGFIRRYPTNKKPLPPLPPPIKYASSSIRGRPANRHNGGVPLPNGHAKLKKTDSMREQLEAQKKYLIPAHRNSGPVNLASNNPAKMIKMDREGAFLDLEPIPDMDKLLMDKKDLCNKFDIGQMKLLRMENTQLNVINEYYVLPNPISGGATSRVFHASPRNAVDIDGQPINQCVSIKSVMLDLLPAEVLEDLKNEQQFLSEFRKKVHNKHIIHLFDKFEDKSKNRLIFVLERGEEDLMHRLQKLRKHWLSENPANDAIRETITHILFQVLEAVSEMHRTIIHLDLKSDNMLFVKKVHNGVEKEMLKVIDFGGSEFIDPNKKSTSNEANVANVCKLRNTMWSDDRYSSPEQIKSCRKKKKKAIEGEVEEPIYPVSSKSDIWAIGMMLIEFLLMTPVFAIDPVVIRQSKDPKNIYNAVLNLNRYKSAKDLVQQPDKPYKMYLTTIEQEFPKFFQIIEACLREKPHNRPTARGIKDFLEGKCEFYKWRNVKRCDRGVQMKKPKLNQD